MAQVALTKVFKVNNALLNVMKIRTRSYYKDSNEPSQPISGKEPKYVNAEQCFDQLKSGNVVFIQGAAATPADLVTAMTKVGKDKKLKDIVLCHIHTEGKAPYSAKEYEGIFRSHSFFVSGNVRKSVAEGRADAMSIFLHEIPYLFYRKIYKPDISIVHVSPPDSHGYCSLGTSVDITRAAICNSKVIVAQVNKKMPRTFGDGIIHISHIDFAYKKDEPLPVHGGKGGLSDTEVKIGKLIAENLVKNGATLQMGIGNIPDAVLSQLGNHKDLGIHTEMFSDGVVALAKKGCITNRLKRTHRGRIVTGFVMGTQNLYDFVHDNPFIEFLSMDYVNNTRVIAAQPLMTAINSAIEVDLTGQVVADSIGTRMYSGFGGQVDFIRGSAEADDGKGVPIIALPSITKKGVSKINVTLKPGAGVVTSRAHVHYVITEHGIANLFGKTMRQRAYELIKISDPKHREALDKAAFELLKCKPSP